MSGSGGGGGGAALLARGGALRFAHGVNTRERLARILATPVEAIEGDVSWGFVTGQAGVLLPIMAHPPREESDLSFADWLDAVLDAGRIAKIDIKDQATNRAVVEIVSARALPTDRFFLNADMVRGPAGPPPIFSAEDGALWRRRFPDVVVSVGCTAGKDRDPYSDDDLRALLDAAAAVGEPVTVCFDVHRVESDPTVLDRVAAAGRHVSLWNQHACDQAIYRRYRARLPAAFIDLFDASRDPIFETGEARR